MQILQYETFFKFKQRPESNPSEMTSSQSQSKGQLRDDSVIMDRHYGRPGNQPDYNLPSNLMKRVTEPIQLHHGRNYTGEEPRVGSIQAALEERRFNTESTDQRKEDYISSNAVPYRETKTNQPYSNMRGRSTNREVDNHQSSHDGLGNRMLSHSNSPFSNKFLSPCSQSGKTIGIPAPPSSQMQMQHFQNSNPDLIRVDTLTPQSASRLICSISPNKISVTPPMIPGFNQLIRMPSGAAQSVRSGRSNESISPPASRINPNSIGPSRSISRENSGNRWFQQRMQSSIRSSPTVSPDAALRNSIGTLLTSLRDLEREQLVLEGRIQDYEKQKARRDEVRLKAIQSARDDVNNELEDSRIDFQSNKSRSAENISIRKIAPIGKKASCGFGSSVPRGFPTCPLDTHEMKNFTLGKQKIAGSNPAIRKFNVEESVRDCPSADQIQEKYQNMMENLVKKVREAEDDFNEAEAAQEQTINKWRELTDQKGQKFGKLVKLLDEMDKEQGGNYQSIEDRMARVFSSPRFNISGFNLSNISQKSLCTMPIDPARQLFQWGNSRTPSPKERSIHDISLDNLQRESSKSIISGINCIFQPLNRIQRESSNTTVLGLNTPLPTFFPPNIRSGKPVPIPVSGTQQTNPRSSIPSGIPFSTPRTISPPGIGFSKIGLSRSGNQLQSPPAPTMIRNQSPPINIGLSRSQTFSINHTDGTETPNRIRQQSPPLGADSTIRPLLGAVNNYPDGSETPNMIRQQSPPLGPNNTVRPDGTETPNMIRQQSPPLGPNNTIRPDGTETPNMIRQQSPPVGPNNTVRPLLGSVNNYPDGTETPNMIRQQSPPVGPNNTVRPLLGSVYNYPGGTETPNIIRRQSPPTGFGAMRPHPVVHCPEGFDTTETSHMKSGGNEIIKSTPSINLGVLQFPTQFNFSTPNSIQRSSSNGCTPRRQILTKPNIFGNNTTIQPANNNNNNNKAPSMVKRYHSYTPNRSFQPISFKPQTSSTEDSGGTIVGENPINLPVYSKNKRLNGPGCYTARY